MNYTAVLFLLSVFFAPCLAHGASRAICHGIMGTQKKVVKSVK